MSEPDEPEVIPPATAAQAREPRTSDEELAVAIVERAAQRQVAAELPHAAPGGPLTRCSPSGMRPSRPT
jgi:hypothetical protein